MIHVQFSLTSKSIVKADLMKAFHKLTFMITLYGLTHCSVLSEGKSVAVLFNSTLPESKAVAEHYAIQRGVPQDHLIGLPLPDSHTIPRQIYASKLERPIISELANRSLLKDKKASIRYLVICWGVPIRVAKVDGLNETGSDQVQTLLRRNEASVDSELSIIPQLNETTKRFGFIPNPGFRKTDPNQISPANGVLMVTRLDGPSPQLAKTLVDKAIAAERDGLWGRAYIDLRGIKDGKLSTGDERLRKVGEITRRSGFTTVVDNQPATLPVGYPASHIAFYAGWYAINVEGVFAESNVEFMPGAIAYHMHSYNGSMLRDPHARWIGPFINKGATATFGSVFEPYLELTPDQPLFFSRLIQNGFSFGEAGYASARALSWQTVFIGDPLYRPFGRDPETVKMELTERNSPMLEWFHLLSINQGLEAGAPAEAAITHLKQLRETKTSAVLQEKLADLLTRNGYTKEAFNAYAIASDLANSPRQKQRLAEAHAKLKK